MVPQRCSKGSRPVGAEDRRRRRRPRAKGRFGQPVRQPGGTRAHDRTRASGQSQRARDIPKRSKTKRNRSSIAVELKNTPRRTRTSAEKYQSQKCGTNERTLAGLASCARVIAERKDATSVEAGGMR